jgi:hypothetical protein
VLSMIKPGTLVIGTVPDFPDVGHVRHYSADVCAPLRLSFHCPRGLFAGRVSRIFIIEGCRADNKHSLTLAFSGGNAARGNDAHIALGLPPQPR